MRSLVTIVSAFSRGFTQFPRACPSYACSFPRDVVNAAFPPQGASPLYAYVVNFTVNGSNVCETACLAAQGKPWPSLGSSSRCSDTCVACQPYNETSFQNSPRGLEAALRSVFYSQKMGPAFPGVGEFVEILCTGGYSMLNGIATTGSSLNTFCTNSRVEIVDANCSSLQGTQGWRSGASPPAQPPPPPTPPLPPLPPLQPPSPNFNLTAFTDCNWGAIGEIPFDSIKPSGASKPVQYTQHSLHWDETPVNLHQISSNSFSPHGTMGQPGSDAGNWITPAARGGVFSQFVEVDGRDTAIDYWKGHPYQGDDYQEFCDYTNCWYDDNCAGLVFEQWYAGAGWHYNCYTVPGAGFSGASDRGHTGVNCKGFALIRKNKP